MANYPGQVAYTPLSNTGFTSGGDTPAAVVAAAIDAQNLPVALSTKNESGAAVGLYGANEWFDRLHVIPNQLSVGTIRLDVTEQIRVYNAGRQTAPVTSVNAQNDNGITISHPAPPFAIGAKRSVLCDVDILIDGPEKIDAQYTFMAGTQALFILQGVRLIAQVWFVSPDWSAPVVEAYQWRTDIQRASAGNELRRGVYQFPRHGLRFRVVTDDIEAVDRLVSGWQSNLYNVPRWQDRTYLTAQAAAGATVLLCNTSVGDWRIGAQIVLIGPDNMRESPVVEAVDIGSITITEPLINTWPVGSPVYPSRLMRLNSQIQFAREASGVIAGEAEFVADRDTGTVYSAAETGDEFDGMPLYLIEPNRVTECPANYSRDSITLDVIGGVMLVDDPTGDPWHGHEWRFDWFSRDDCDAFIQWLFARAGRANAFGTPTWSEDMTVVDTIQPDDTVLRVKPIEWTAFYAGRRNRDTVALQDIFGDWHFAKVLSSSIGGGVEQLALDRPLINAPDPAMPAVQVRRVCWLQTVRLDHDRIEIAWTTDSATRTTLRLLGVPA